MWEYDVVGWGHQNSHGGRSGPAGAASMLNERGSQGWELVAVSPSPANAPSGTWFVFKRETGASVAEDDSASS